MNETVAELLKGLEPVPAEAQAIADLQHPPFIAKELEQLGKFLEIPGDGTGRLVNGNAIAVLFGFGESGALQIFHAYTEQTFRTAAEAAVTWDALRRVTRQAKASRLLGWCLDSIKADAVKGKPKLLILLDRDLDDRFRTAAAARGETLRAFVSDAIRARLAEVEGRRAPAKPRAEKEAASA